MGKQTEYQRGRLDGLDMALRIVKDGGTEALEKEVRMRGAWGINTALLAKELDQATEPIKRIVYQTMQIASLVALHDSFGFGPKRGQRFLDAFWKLVMYLDHGWLHWYDLITEIQKSMKLNISFEDITHDSMGRDYAHPEPEDIYSEDDFVDSDAWKGLLKQLKFSEDPAGRILDEHGEPFLTYEGNYNKIQVYDVLSGLELAKDHWEIEY